MQFICLSNLTSWFNLEKISKSPWRKAYRVQMDLSRVLIPRNSISILLCCSIPQSLQTKSMSYNCSKWMQSAFWLLQCKISENLIFFVAWFLELPNVVEMFKSNMQYYIEYLIASLHQTHRCEKIYLNNYIRW